MSAEAAAMRRSPTAVVVAHPDDEALWLSSAVASADRVVFCFGDLFERPRDSEARRQAVAALPLTGVVDLAIPESGAGWIQPQSTAAAIRIADAAARDRYESNYAILVDSLRASLAGIENVYTHNPWGEYGHAEHIQVHRAVATLQEELKFTLWFSNYVSSRTWPLARAFGDRLRLAQRRIVHPDRAIVRRLGRIYRHYGAWTWNAAHCWPAREAIYALSPASSLRPPRPASGEWLLDIGRLRWWSPLRPFARRQLGGY
jgi:LmbE family N-acetylglucosaminyl deacetylase